MDRVIVQPFCRSLIGHRLHEQARRSSIRSPSGQVMRIERQLAQNLTSESKAYGYTLSIWGGGTVLSHVYHSPNLIEGFAYIIGALVAFGVIAGVTFDRLVIESDVGSERIPVPSMLHLIAVIGAVAVGVVIAKAVSVVALPALVGFVVVGFQVTLLYNLFLPLELEFVRRVFSIESGDTSVSS